MAFSLSGLSNYSDEQSKELLVKTLFGSTTAGYAVPQLGIKSSRKLQLLDDTLYLQDGGSCGFTATGTTTISQRTLTVGDCTINKEWCIKDLEAKWTQILLRQGSAYNETDLPIAITDFVMNLLKQTLETADWQADTTSGDPNLNRYDGIKKIISDAGTAIDANVAAYIGTPITSWTTANIAGSFDAMVFALAENKPGVLAKGDVKIFVGREVFARYAVAIRNSNYFGYNGTGEQNPNVLPLLGHAGVEVVAVDGLNGTDDAYIMSASNLYMGMDGEGDSENVRLWYSMDDDVVRMRIDFKRGWQIAYPNEVAYIVL